MLPPGCRHAMLLSQLSTKVSKCDTWDTTKRSSKRRTILILSRSMDVCKCLRIQDQSISSLLKILVAAYLFFKMSSDQYTYKLYSEFAITHNDPAIDFDSAAAWNDINMDFSIPIGTCELGVWIAKGNMQARHLLILQQVAHKSLETCKRTDGKFSHAVAIGGGEEVIIHFLCQRCILASDVYDVALFYVNHDGMLQYTIFL